jgi:hypothetical protein
MNKFPMKLKVTELKLGDVVALEFNGGPWNHAIVRNITKTDVVLWRPYGTTTNFSYTGGVICLIGVEDNIDYSLTTDQIFEVVQRTELK